MMDKAKELLKTKPVVPCQNVDWLISLQQALKEILGFPDEEELKEENVSYSHLHSNDDVFELILNHKHFVARSFSKNHFVIVANASEEEIEDSIPEIRPNWRLISIIPEWECCEPLLNYLKPEPMESDPQNIHVNSDGMELVLCSEHLRKERISKSYSVIMTTSCAQDKEVYEPEDELTKGANFTKECQLVPTEISMDIDQSQSHDCTPIYPPEETKPIKLKDLWINDYDVVLGKVYNATTATEIFTCRVCSLYAWKQQLKDSHVVLMKQILQEELRDTQGFNKNVPAPTFWILLSESWDGMADQDSDDRESKWLLKDNGGDFDGPYVKASTLAIQKFVTSVRQSLLEKSSAQRSISDTSCVTLDMIEMARDGNASVASSECPHVSAVEAASVASSTDFPTVEPTPKFHIALDPLTEETNLIEEPPKSAPTNVAKTNHSKESVGKNLSEYLNKTKDSLGKNLSVYLHKTTKTPPPSGCNQNHDSASTTSTVVATAVPASGDDATSSTCKVFQLSGSIHEAQENIRHICQAWVDDSDTMLIKVTRKCSVEMFQKDVKNLLPLIVQQLKLIQGITSPDSSWISLESNDNERIHHAKDLESAFIGFLNQLGNDMIRRYEQFYGAYSNGQHQDYKLIKGPSTKLNSHLTNYLLATKGSTNGIGIPIHGEAVNANVACFHAEIKSDNNMATTSPALCPSSDQQVGPKKISWQTAETKIIPKTPVVKTISSAGVVGKKSCLKNPCAPIAIDDNRDDNESYNDYCDDYGDDDDDIEDEDSDSYYGEGGGEDCSTNCSSAGRMREGSSYEERSVDGSTIVSNMGGSTVMSMSYESDDDSSTVSPYRCSPRRYKKPSSTSSTTSSIEGGGSFFGCTPLWL